MNTILPGQRSLVRTLYFLTVAVVAILLTTPERTAAQAPDSMYQISQRATVSQKLGRALVSLDYSRPLARGRSDLFGKVVHWGELWTPGANDATVLEVSEEVKLNGHAVPQGRWSMWIIPSQVGPWELVLDSRDTLFHTQRPELTDDQIRFVVDVEEGSHVEVLTWAFPRVAHDGATLLMNWGTVQIPIQIDVETIKPVLTVNADEARRYVGEWHATFTPNPETGEAFPPAILTVRHGDDGALYGHLPSVPLSSAPDSVVAQDADMTPQERERAEARRTLAEMATGEFEYVFVPRAEGVFLFGYMDDGELLEVQKVYHEFEFEGDRAVRLTIRNDEDRIFLTATREKQ